MALAPALFFRLELADAIVYKFTTAFVDFNFTFLFIDVGTWTKLFYTSYSYNSVSWIAYRGISAHISRRDLVIFCVLRSH